MLAVLIKQSDIFVNLSNCLNIKNPQLETSASVFATTRTRIVVEIDDHNFSTMFEEIDS